MSVALVLVSHSRAAAEGTAEIARQMAPDVRVLPAGGIGEDLGTSFDLVLSAIEDGTGDGAGVVVLTDLGSAVLTAESALEALDEEVAARVRVPTAPFIEGAVAAAVRAQQGGDLDAVAEAAVRAADMFAPAAQPPTDRRGALPDAGGVADEGAGATARVVLVNPLGLHARPAAVLARSIAGLGVPVRVNGVNGASVLELMQLGAVGGDEVVVSAEGPGAAAAVDEVVAMIRDGLGEA